MSNKLAQTVRSRKIAALVAIFALIVVFGLYLTGGTAHAQNANDTAAVVTTSHGLTVANIDVNGFDINHPPGIASSAVPGTWTTTTSLNSALTTAESNTLRDSRYVIATTLVTTAAPADTASSSVFGVNNTTTDIIGINATTTGRSLLPVSSSASVQAISGHNSDPSMIMVLALTVLFAAILLSRLHVHRTIFANGNPSSSEGAKGRITERLGAPTHWFASLFANTRTRNDAMRHGEDSDVNSAQVGNTTAQASLGTDGTDGADSADPFDTA